MSSDNATPRTDEIVESADQFTPYKDFGRAIRLCAELERENTLMRAQLELYRELLRKAGFVDEDELL